MVCWAKENIPCMILAVLLLIPAPNGIFKSITSTLSLFMSKPRISSDSKGDHVCIDVRMDVFKF